MTQMLAALILSVLALTASSFGAEKGTETLPARGAAQGTEKSKAKKVPLLLDSQAPNAVQNFVFLEQLPPSEETHSIFEFRLGQVSNPKISLSETSYDFSYPQNSSSGAVMLGWESTPWEFWRGRAGYRFDLGYSLLVGDVTFVDGTSAGRSRMHQVPLSLGAIYFGESLTPFKWIMPVVEAGVGYHSYLQSGDIDGIQSRGGVASFHMLMGFRSDLGWLGLNRSLLTVDYRRTLTGASSRLDVSGDSFWVGYAVRL